MPPTKLIASICTLLLGLFCLLGLGVRSASAEVVDRIQIFQAGDEAEIRIRFVTRVQYLRQVMLKNGDVRIYFNLLEIDAADPRLTWQRRDSPPSNIVPRFTVTYPEIDSSLSISFGKALSYHIRPGNDGRSISFFTPIVGLTGKGLSTYAPTQVPTGTAPKAPPRTAAELAANESEAREIMHKAGDALNRNDNDEAIRLLTRLLDLPQNQQSQPAQYMIAQVYERNKEFVKARDSYNLYIKSYPSADNLAQARASLGRVFMAAYEEEKSVPEKLAISDSMSYFGGFSQYFSKGFVQTDSTAVPTSVVTTSNSSDLYQLLSSLDLTGQKRSETTTTRLVLRDTFTANFLPDQPSSNFLTAAYFEKGANDERYFYGLGRQTGASGGLPSRFDGAWLNRRIGKWWRINGALGMPVAPPASDLESKAFSAVSIDLTRLPGQWSGNTYLIAQRVGHVLDRRAVGIETRYFNAQNNHMGLFEYDTLFKKLNVGLIQGNWTTVAGANYNLLIEQRRSLAITNALFLEPPKETVKNLVDSGVTSDILLQNALLASPIFNQFMVGMTQPYSPRIKLGGDFRATNTTSYEAFNADPLVYAREVIPRSWAYIYTAQIIGNNLFFNNDLGVASLSYTNASTYNGRTFTYSQVASFREKLQVNLSLQLYDENNNVSVNLTRVSPAFRLSYRMSNALNFELGAGLVLTHTTSPDLDDKTRKRYFNLGYRWDF